MQQGTWKDDFASFSISLATKVRSQRLSISGSAHKRRLSSPSAAPLLPQADEGTLSTFSYHFPKGRGSLVWLDFNDVSLIPMIIDQGCIIQMPSWIYCSLRLLGKMRGLDCCTTFPATSKHIWKRFLELFNWSEDLLIKRRETLSWLCARRSIASVKLLFSIRTRITGSANYSTILANWVIWEEKWERGKAVRDCGRHSCNSFGSIAAQMLLLDSWIYISKSTR